MVYIVVLSFYYIPITTVLVTIYSVLASPDQGINIIQEISQASLIIVCETRMPWPTVVLQRLENEADVV